MESEIRDDQFKSPDGDREMPGGIILSVVVFWQTADDVSGSAESEVCIHVAASNVEVLVNEKSFRVEMALKDVIVCRVRPGWHVLRMERDGNVVYQEGFSVERGRDVVLTAWEAPSDTTPFPRLAPPHKLSSGK